MPLDIFLMNMCIVVIALLIRKEINLKKHDKILLKEFFIKVSIQLKLFSIEYSLILYKKKL